MNGEFVFFVVVVVFLFMFSFSSFSWSVGHICAMYKYNTSTQWNFSLCKIIENALGIVSLCCVFVLVCLRLFCLLFLFTLSFREWFRDGTVQLRFYFATNHILFVSGCVCLISMKRLKSCAHVSARKKKLEERSRDMVEVCSTFNWYLFEDGISYSEDTRVWSLRFCSLFGCLYCATCLMWINDWSFFFLSSYSEFIADGSQL